MAPRDLGVVLVVATEAGAVVEVVGIEVGVGTVGLVKTEDAAVTSGLVTGGLGIRTAGFGRVTVGLVTVGTVICMLAREPGGIGGD